MRGGRGTEQGKSIYVPPLRSIAPAPKAKVVIVGSSGKFFAAPTTMSKGIKGNSVKVGPPDKGERINFSKESVGGIQKGKGFGPVGPRVPTKSCIGDASGWVDCSEKFVMTPSDAKREDYFRVYGPSCSYRMKSDVMSDKGLKDRLGSLEYISKPCLFDEDMLYHVRYAFQILADVEIRIPEEGEKIYCRSGDLWVGIPLEHFRAGLRFPLYRFIHSLLVGLRLGLGQLGPNSIRKICAFITRCTTLRLEPTLSLFWSFHKPQASRNYDPLFEIHWKEGKALGGCLVDVPSSNKGWHGEF